jgi:uncharacterized membrane protein
MIVLSAGLIVCLIVFDRLRRLDRQLAQLKFDFGRLSDELNRFRSPQPDPRAFAEPQPGPGYDLGSAAAAEAALRAAEQPHAEKTGETAPAGETLKAEEPEEPTPPGVKPLEEPVAETSMEQRLASRWFVWIGGAAIALGGLLFVKYAHDHGLIPPMLRVIIGLAFAAALIFAGERLRLKRDEKTRDYVPAALSAAGIIIAFGVIYAAHALYGLLSPGACFPLLVAIGLFALWLSRRQGPLIAALGLVGSYAAPALVPSEHPSAWGFFAYLFVIVGASLFELRNRPWWWVGYAGIAGATLWALYWINGGLFDPSHAIPSGLFALALGGATTLVPKGWGILDEKYGAFVDLRKIEQPLWIAIAGISAATLILASLVWRQAYATNALIIFSIGMIALAVFGWVRKGTSFAAVAAAVITLLVFMAWPAVGFHTWAFDERGFWATVPGLIEPYRFRNWMLAALIGFAALGLAGTRFKNNKDSWAVLAAASAVLFVFGAWARADFTLRDMTWAGLAALLALVLLAASWQVRNVADRWAYLHPADVLLIGSALLLAFGADRVLDNVWYTLAVAALAAAYAYASRLHPTRWIGAIAVFLASFASARLFVGREFWQEPNNIFLGDHWPLYGYGVPAMLFWLSSRRLDAGRYAKWRITLDGLSLGLAIALVSLELRVIIGGGIVDEEPGLLEMGAHAVSWLSAAYALAYRQKVFSSLISRWGAIVLIGASSLFLVVCLTVLNPAFRGKPIAGGAIVNALWLAYLAPVALIALVARKMENLGIEKFRNAYGLFALVLLLAFATLEIMRLHQGPSLVAWFQSDAESYTVSLAWLVMAVAFFLSGMRIERQNIRYGGLIIMIVTVLKVFIFDLEELEGLWRIASLMGLGFCLVGIGWLYTRFVQKRQRMGLQQAKA